MRDDSGIAPAALQARVADALEVNDCLRVALQPELEQAERRSGALDGRPYPEALGEVERVLGAGAAVLLAPLGGVQPGEAAERKSVVGRLTCSAASRRASCRRASASGQRPVSRSTSARRTSA